MLLKSPDFSCIACCAEIQFTTLSIVLFSVLTASSTSCFSETPLDSLAEFAVFDFAIALAIDFAEKLLLLFNVARFLVI